MNTQKLISVLVTVLMLTLFALSVAAPLRGNALLEGVGLSCLDCSSAHSDDDTFRLRARRYTAIYTIPVPNTLLVSFDWGVVRYNGERLERGCQVIEADADDILELRNAWLGAYWVARCTTELPIKSYQQEDVALWQLHLSRLCHKLFTGAEGKTRTHTAKGHTALNRARLPITPHYWQNSLRTPS